MTTANAIQVIHVYKWNGLWVFDDAHVDLDHEPFVAGIPVMIDMLLGLKGLQKAQNFSCLFSSGFFPGAQELKWAGSEGGGNLYTWEGYTGWLCPALLKYFDKAPRSIFVDIQS